MQSTQETSSSQNNMMIVPGSETIFVKVAKIKDEAFLPEFGTEYSAGADLKACLIDEEGKPYTAIIPHGETTMIPTGIKTEIPKGYVGLVYARSGLASKRGLAPANCVGVIDSDYRGEWFVPLHNHTKNVIESIEHGDKIAQVIIMPYPHIDYQEVNEDELTDTKRGQGGFGSTGK